MSLNTNLQTLFISALLQPLLRKKVLKRKQIKRFCKIQIWRQISVSSCYIFTITPIVSDRSLSLFKRLFKAQAEMWQCVNCMQVLKFEIAVHNRKYLFSSSTYSQEYLQWGVSHLYELKIHQTARYRYISVVLGCPRGRRSDGCHPAPRAVLHPPGAMHGQVERQDKVRVLARKNQRERQTERELNYILRHEADHQAECQGWF